MTSPSSTPQTDRRRVKAIRDTYAAAWSMAGEIMASGGPDQAWRPDQHAAAATLFIQMCRLDVTMVWMEKGDRLEWLRDEEMVIKKEAHVEMVQTIEELQQAVRDG